MATTFVLKSSKTVPLTRELARKHRQMKPSPTERDLQEPRLKFLRGKLKNGLFIPCSWSIAVCDGTEHRMNGNHSSTVLDECDGDFPKNLFAHLDYYEVAQKEDLALLFRQFDARQSSRSTLDVSGAYQGLHDDLATLNRRYANIAVKGIAWYMRRIEGVAAPSGDDVGDLFSIAAHHSFIIWFAGEILSIKTPELMVDWVASAAYGTFIANEAEARVFWRDVAVNQRSDDTLPSEVLSAELCAAKAKEGDFKGLKPGEYYAKCVKAWKAHRGGDRIHSLKVNISKGLEAPVA